MKDTIIPNIIKIKVKLSSLIDIAFDRFVSHSSEKLPTDEKLYLDENRGAYIPSWNMDAFLWGEYPAGVCAYVEKKKRKDYSSVGVSTVSFDNPRIPLLKKGKPVVVKKDITKDENFWILSVGPRCRKGNLSIKMEARERPVLKAPWDLEFSISLIENPIIDPKKLQSYFITGGAYIGIGTFRPKLGRFMVSGWEVE